MKRPAIDQAAVRGPSRHPPLHLQQVPPPQVAEPDQPLQHRRQAQAARLLRLLDAPLLGSELLHRAGQAARRVAIGAVAGPSPAPGLGSPGCGRGQRLAADVAS